MAGCGYYDRSGEGLFSRSDSPVGGTASAPVETRIPAPADGMHTVARGNTVYAVSRIYGVPVRAIIEANGLQPPYLLRVGDRLRIPSPRMHNVAKGDTVYSISRRYDVPMNELMRANGIAPPYKIVIGQQLSIPTASNAPPGGDPDAVQQEELASDSPPPQDAVAVAPVTAPPVNVAAPPAAAPPKASPAQIAALPNPAPRAGKTFQWPVRGKIVLGYGRQSGGSHNDGINIAAARGTSVVAAENGVVAYAGNELRGFGNLLLIKHADGYMTAYAHNAELLVARGQTVRKGQAIARVGSTGSVATPQLHFEIRKGRKAVDPAQYLPRQTATAN